MLIRRLKDADRQDMVRLYAKVYGLEDNKTDNPLNDPIRLGNESYGAFLDGKLVGGVTGLADDTPEHEQDNQLSLTHYIDQIFVDPDYERRGIGERLLETITAVFDTSAGGVPPDRQYTTSVIAEDNTTSQELHRKLGFQPSREHSSVWQRTGFAHILSAE